MFWQITSDLVVPNCGFIENAVSGRRLTRQWGDEGNVQEASKCLQRGFEDSGGVWWMLHFTHRRVQTGTFRISHVRETWISVQMWVCRGGESKVQVSSHQFPFVNECATSKNSTCISVVKVSLLCNKHLKCNRRSEEQSFVHERNCKAGFKEI